MSRFQKDDDLSIEDPSTRSESPISPPKDSEESIHLTGIKLPPTSAAGASKSEDLSVLSSYKSATSTPSIHSSKSDETFHSALPSLSTERTISALDKSNPSKSSLGETETDVNFVPSTSSSNTASGDTNKFLDYDDFFAAKKLLGKLCKTMVESSCHHAKKTQEFNKNLDKIGSAVEDHASVLKAFIDDFDVKAAEKVKQMVHKIDPQMSALEEIAEFSSALDSLDGWLHLCEVENDQRLETLEIAQKNLVKQKELELMVKQFEESSIKHRAVFNALELDDSRMLHEALSLKTPLDSNNYGVKENKQFVPEFLADIEDFEEDLSEIKQFFVASGFVHPEYFEKLEYLLSNVKSEVQEHIEPLSVMSFMPSLLTTPTSKSSSIAFSTEDYRNVLSSSSSKNEELGIGSATTRSLSETSILSDSTQTSSIGCDSVVSTQTSVSVFDTVDPTQASATDLETVESTQASVSKESVGPSTSVSSYCSIDLECDKTQNSDPSVKTAISPQSSSSLKTALSLHDTCSNDSSSTVAI